MIKTCTDAGPTSAIIELTTGIRLRVRLTPRSDRDAIGTGKRLFEAMAVLEVRVRAVPEDGKANAALEILLAKAAGVARTRVNVVSGATSRIKIVEIEGDVGAILSRLGQNHDGG